MAQPQTIPLRHVSMPEPGFCTWCANDIAAGDTVFIRHPHDGFFCSQRCERQYQQEWDVGVKRLAAVIGNPIANHGSTAAVVG